MVHCRATACGSPYAATGNRRRLDASSTPVRTRSAAAARSPSGSPTSAPGQPNARCAARQRRRTVSGSADSYVALGRVWLDIAHAADRIALDKAIGALQGAVGRDDGSEALALFGRALLLDATKCDRGATLQEATRRPPSIRSRSLPRGGRRAPRPHRRSRAGAARLRPLRSRGPHDPDARRCRSVARFGEPRAATMGFRGGIDE